MSTTTKTTRGKPVTLAKSASATPASAKATEKAAPKAVPVKPEKIEAAKPAAPIEQAPAANAAPSLDAEAPGSTVDPAFAAKWNDLVKAQSDAAMAWWEEAKEARTIADAIAVNARHSRAQLDLATGQAREMASFFQKTFEGNAERIRAMLTSGRF